MCVLQALTRVNPTVYDSVAALCNNPDTTVVVFSGSDKWKLEETFGELNVWLAAENGMFMRAPDSNWSNLLEARHSLLLRNKPLSPAPKPAVESHVSLSCLAAMLPPPM